MQCFKEQLTDKQFRKFCSLVYDECGIHLTDEKRELLHARLAKRLRAHGVTVRQYYEMIVGDPLERMRFIDAVSTNHTYFFRESRSFDYISDTCRDIWCAAGSSGEEPYSVAAFCLERGIEPSILATDISETCLEKGYRGVYPDHSIRNIPVGLLKKYFQKGCGRWQGFIRVKPKLRDIVRFKHFNLLRDDPPDRQFDVIFCRNVMIYFDKPTKEKVVEKLSGVLKSNGFFIIGGAESLSGLRHSLVYLEPSVYRKP